jgi:hypothetical protein
MVPSEAVMSDAGWVAGVQICTLRQSAEIERLSGAVNRNETFTRPDAPLAARKFHCG